MKVSELFIDVRVRRGSDIGSDHLLASAKLRFPHIKLDCSMTNVYNGYTYKEFKRKYMRL
jgi:hypothetical protein